MQVSQETLKNKCFLSKNLLYALSCWESFCCEADATKLPSILLSRLSLNPHICWWLPCFLVNKTFFPHFPGQRTMYPQLMNKCKHVSYLVLMVQTNDLQFYACEPCWSKLLWADESGGGQRPPPAAHPPLIFSTLVNMEEGPALKPSFLWVGSEASRFHYDFSAHYI